MTERYGMGTLVYSPLVGGTLTGRYRAGQANDNFRSTRTGMRHFRTRDVSQPSKNSSLSRPH